MLTVVPSTMEAKENLLEIREELKPVNLSAVRSLDEGFEETLTLHRLGLFEELGCSFLPEGRRVRQLIVLSR